MKISVIIPTRNRADLLKECLKSLSRQQPKLEEIIVVDNNSRDNTKEVVLSFKNKLPIRYIWERKIGAPNARNRGIKEAKNNFLVFLDDDCLVSKNWSKQTVETCKLIKNKNLIIQGGYKEDSSNIFSLVHHYLNQQSMFAAIKASRNKFGGFKIINFIDTKNLVVNKKEIGGIFFDSAFSPFTFAEGRDFALRLKEKGLRILYNPKISVEHKGRSSFLSLLKSFFTKGRGLGFFDKKWSRKIKRFKKIKRFFEDNKKARKYFENQEDKIEINRSLICNLLKEKKLVYKLLFYLILFITILSFKLGYFYEKIFKG